MPSQTTRGFPYPLGTDRVMDGDDAIKSLAENVDAKCACHATGSWALPGLTAGATGSQTITLPAGRFVNAPTGSANITIGNPTGSNTTAAWVANSSPTSITINARRATAGDMQGTWIVSDA